MEKEQQPDSMTTVNIKPDYAPSEVYSSEPPPAYHRGQSAAVQVAKIVAVTVVLVSVVLGSFILASAYVTANASCRQLELELLGEAAAIERFQQQQPLQPEALVQDEPQHQNRVADQKPEESVKKTEEAESSDNSLSSDESDEDSKEIRFKLPLQLDFDDLAGALFEKNQKSRMNCIVEKKRAEEIVDHKPKMLNLPFGLNLTTDPRLERISGERMAIFCESGNMMQRQNPSQEDDDDDSSSSSNSNDSDDDSDEATIMIQPVMVPIPQSPMHTHMAHQMPQPQMVHQPMHPMETMRPPMPPQSQSQELPPNQFIHHIVQQIIAQKIMDARRQAQEQNSIVEARPEEGRLPIPEEILSQLNRLPNREQVIVAVADQDSGENQQGPINQQPQEMNHITAMHVIPQTITPLRMIPQEEMQTQPQLIQQQRSNAQDMNGRQTYARGLPVHIPVHMVQREQEPVAAATEEMRPHYVQPRSVRSVDAVLPKNQKRIKRCACDCAC